MTSREEKKAMLKEKAEGIRKKTDAILEDELNSLLEVTSSDLEALRPKISNEEEFDKLIAAVEDSTRRNEALADLKNRLEKLGKNAIIVVKEAARLLKG